MPRARSAHPAPPEAAGAAIADAITDKPGLVASAQAPDAAARERLAALLTYGDAYRGPTEGGE
ncbi:UNVERIFIED_CONTAM: hypothetical protein IGO34_35120, partial [Salmonella enterica subsp. enterica serovar Weltevreden]